MRLVNAFKFLKPSIFFTAVLTIYSPYSVAGGASTGGGMGVITANGQIQLLDLASASEAKSLKPNSEFEKYFPTYQNKLGEIAVNFFECSKKVLLPYKKDFPILALASEIDSELKPVLVRFRLIKAKPSTEHRLPIDIPIAAAASDSIPATLQEPLAAYVKGRLWITAPIYTAMDDKNRCGLQVHETLRHINYKNLTAFNLSTAEIEQLTKFFIDDHSEEAISNSTFLKLKYMTSDKKEIHLSEILTVADEIDFEATNLNAIISNSDISPTQRNRVIDQQQGLRKKAANLRTNALSDLTANSYQAVDELNIPAILIEKTLTAIPGVWNTKTFEKLD